MNEIQILHQNDATTGYIDVTNGTHSGRFGQGGWNSMALQGDAATIFGGSGNCIVSDLGGGDYQLEFSGDLADTDLAELYVTDNQTDGTPTFSTQQNGTPPPPPDPPVAAFYLSVLSGTAPLLSQGIDESTNAPTSWLWEKSNNGGASWQTFDSEPNAQHPQETFAAGTWSIRLTATNAGGSDQETKLNYLTATPPAPVADFSATPMTGAAPLQVQFSDLTTNAPTSWLWEKSNNGGATYQNFDSEPTAQHPQETFSDGNWSIRLTATNAGGSGQEIKLDYLTVTPPAPVADFSAAPTTGAAPLQVQFSDLTTNAPTSWLWEKSDDNGATWENFAAYPTLQNPSEEFPAGTWSIRLTATNAGGSDGETKLDYLTVDPAGPPDQPPGGSGDQGLGIGPSVSI